MRISRAREVNISSCQICQKMGRKPLYASKEEKLEARRVKERLAYKQKKDKGTAVKQAIHLGAPDIIERWNKLREQAGISSNVAFGRLLLDR